MLNKIDTAKYTAENIIRLNIAIFSLIFSSMLKVKFRISSALFLTKKLIASKTYEFRYLINQLL